MELLEALEEKIDLNLRINGTLTAIRRTHFRGLAAQPSESAKPIDDLASVRGGSTPSTKVGEYWDGTIAWATPRDLSRLSTPVLLDTERHITEAGVHQISSGVLPPGTVLLSSRAPIGYLAISEVPVAVNQGFIAMVPDKGVSSWFLLSWAESAIDEIKGRANGTTFQEINKANFRPIKVRLPSRTALAKFDGIVKPLYARIVSNERENHTLTRLRDALLPKLVSGELRIADAKNMVGAAV